MKKFLPPLLIFLLVICKTPDCICQTLTNAEYFLNSDPGIGKGISINVNDFSEAKFTIPVSTLSKGFNQLFIRVRDNSNTWSIAEQRTFYIDNSLNALSPSLTSAEYFIDVDPGIGKGTPSPVTKGDSVISVFSINTSTLASGFHQLYIRVKDSNNNWSIAEQRSFYIDNTFNQSKVPLISSEYFFDTDPGLGNGIHLPIQTVDSINTLFNINISGLVAGFHQLFIRVKDQNNNWSTAKQRTFLIDSSFHIAPSPLVAAEYYINKDSGIGNNTPINILKGNLVDTTYKYTANDLPFGKYTMNLRVRDSIGNWSIVESRPFTVCTYDAPISRFNFAILDSNVSFINNSSYVSAYHWSFGNGDTSDLPNPYYKYIPGIYNACLISKNDCLPNGDTLCKTVTVVGLATINTNHGGNTGTVSVSVTGAGFVPGMQLYLHENGQQDIYGDTLIIISNDLMITTFDLRGKKTGAWDVIAIFPNGKSDTLHNGFTIQTGTSTNLWVNITGDRVLRIGFNQVYSVIYGNSGNTDAIMVPLLIKGLPIGTKIEILNPLFRLDSIPEFDMLSTFLDTVNRTVNDSVNLISLRLLYINKIAANSTRSIQVIFHVPATTRLHSNSNIQVILGQPQGAISKSIINRNEYVTSFKNENFDWDKLRECATDAIEAAASFSGISDWYDCVSSTLSTINSIGTIATKYYLEPPHDFFCKTCQEVFDGGDLATGVFQNAEACFKAITKTFFPESRFLTLFDKFDKYEDIISKGFEGANTGSSCGESAANIIKVLIGNFWDPNSKYGIGDSSENHYVRNLPLSYIINIENDPAANSNAPTVSILDTLNRGYYDYSSFGFNSVSVGDSIYSLINPAKSLVHDFDFTQLYGVKARVTATFDTTTGIAQWSFFSIDPLTNQQTTNLQLGFLPPDIISPKGQGYVSFTVNPALTIKDGDEICNKAIIVFYPNPPIVTDCFKNVFDLISPVSKVSQLPPKIYNDTIGVRWKGSDNLSGVSSYTIYVSINDSAYVPWIVDTTGLNAFYIGTVGKTYSFYSIATDNAGNVELSKNAPDAVTTIDSNASLPVTLINFQAKCLNNKTVLTWQTATEINSSFFEIQKSTSNETNWNKLGVVNAAGNSYSLKNYQFTDDKTNGQALYRLRQVDIDDKAVYSNIIPSNCDLDGTIIRIYPIPSNNELNILILSDKNVFGSISLIDVYGKTLKRFDRNLRIGSNNILINVKDLASGEYYLRINGINGIIAEKVIIMH